MAASKNSINIIQAQNGWLAVEKPCGMSVHNDPGNDLVSKLTDQIKTDTQLVQTLGVKPGNSVHPVHRLDKETSGVILLACKENILRQLSEQFALHQVKKEYLALIHGQIDESITPGTYQTWDYSLAKKAGGRNNPKGKKPFVACETRYQLLEKSPHYSLLKIDLITGRKHQIRRHAKLAGHPVTGDNRYGSKKSVDFLKNKRSYHRLGLHCQSIEFKAPGSNNKEQSICIQSKNSLEEMMTLLKMDK